MSYANLNTLEKIPAPQKMGRHMYKPQAQAPINILLVEDDISDVMLTEIALDNACVDYELHTLQSGADVVPYLSAQKTFRDEPKPDMLMLDLSLPIKDGFEVLAEMAAKAERYTNLPIVILTGDTKCAFLKKSYDLNIVAYITKPCSAEKIRQAMLEIQRGT